MTDKAPLQQASAPDTPLEMLIDAVRAVYKHRYVALAIFLGVAFLGILLTIRQTPVYEAVATVEIDLREERVLNDVNDVYQLGDLSYIDAESYLQTQYKVIQSRTVAKMVVERLHLDHDPGFLGLDPSLDARQLEAAAKALDPVDILRAGLIVDPVPDSRIVQIRYRGSDPARITTIVNAYVDAYIEQNLDRKLTSTKNAMGWLADQFKDLKQKLEDSERALYSFRKENDILSTDMDGKVNITGARLASLSEEVGRAEIVLLQKRMQLDSVTSILPKDESRLEDAGAVEALRSPLIKDLKVSVAQLQSKVTELSALYKDKHPDLMLAKSQLERTRENLRQEIRSVVAGLKADLEAQQKLTDSLHGAFDAIKNQAKDLTLKQVEYNRLNREKDSNQRVFEQVMSRMKEIDLSSMLKVNNIRPLDKARMPEEPVLPRTNLNILLSLLLGLFLAIGIAILLENFDRTLKTPEDVQRFVGIPVLGVVPSAAIEAKSTDAEIPNAVDIYAQLKPKSALAEHCRNIRTNISFSSPEKPLHTLLITSASPREGKTAIASNLCITLAASGKRVLLVDTDMRRPRVHHAFNIHNEFGLSNVIMGKMSIEEAARDSGIPNLSLLTCGPIPPNPAELIGSNVFTQIVAGLRERYDWVVFDSPPVVAVTDAMILSSLTDGVILVVKHAQTPRDLAAQSAAQLLGVGANLLGVVLNDMPLGQRSYGRYYRYYHKYDYYHRYGTYHLENKDKDSAAG